MREKEDGGVDERHEATISIGRKTISNIIG
jgi:hypothetical protein